MWQFFCFIRRGTASPIHETKRAAAGPIGSAAARLRFTEGATAVSALDAQRQGSAVEGRSPDDALRTSPSPSGEGRGEGGTPDDDVVLALEKIHDQLERAHRKDRQHDFSFLRLFGALLQMLAIVAALCGVVALLDDQSAPAAARLTLACFFQLAALTAFAIDRFR